MGNSMRAPGTNMNPIDRDTIFGREMIRILGNIKEPKLGKTLPSATDDNGKEIEGQYFKYRAQACCIDAILDREPSGVKQTEQAVAKKMLYIPIPDIAKKDDGTQTSCNDIGQSCLETVELGINFTKEKAQCGNDLNMNQSIICDTVVKDICAKQLYDQNCIVDTGRINEDTGDQLYDWNYNNPECTKLVGKGKFYYGTKLCSCANSQLGPNLNLMPSSTVRNNLREFKNDEAYLKKIGLKSEDININPYALNDMNSFTSDNDSTVYSMNVNGLDFNQIFPQSLDSTCAVNVTNGAYNLIKDQTNKSIICMNQINIKNTTIEGNLNLTNVSQSCPGGVDLKSKSAQTAKKEYEAKQRELKEEQDREATKKKQAADLEAAKQRDLEEEAKRSVAASVTAAQPAIPETAVKRTPVLPQPPIPPSVVIKPKVAPPSKVVPEKKSNTMTMIIGVGSLLLLIIILIIVFSSGGKSAETTAK